MAVLERADIIRSAASGPSISPKPNLSELENEANYMQAHEDLTVKTHENLM